MQDTHIQIRINKETKKEFSRACKQIRKPISEVLRNAVYETISQKR